MGSPSGDANEWLREFELLEGDENELKESRALGQSPELSTQLQNTALKRLSEALQSDLQDVIPWFYSQMPPLYNCLTSEEEMYDHILEIVSGKVFAEPQVVERNNTKMKSTTYMSNCEDRYGLVKLVPELSRRKAKFAYVISSLDTRLAIGNLYHGQYEASPDWEQAELKPKKQKVVKLLGDEPRKAVNKYLDELDVLYAGKATAKMIATGFRAVGYSYQTDASFVDIKHVADLEEPRVRVDLALKGYPLTAACEAIVGIFTRYDLSVRRVIGHIHKTTDRQDFTVVHVVAASQTGKRLSQTDQVWGRITKALKSLSFVDHGDEFTVLMQGRQPYSINETNFVRATANWTHIFLSKDNPHYYTFDRVAKVLVRSDAFMDRLIGYFRSRFDPRFEGDRSVEGADISRSIEAIIMDSVDEIERSILKESFNFVRHILKTNYFLVSKAALAFRIDPSLLNKTHYPHAPYGIFYMIGRGVRGFQVRYRDISRGGVRVVMPRSAADYDNALAGLFDEVNGLAFAQQLKNKDIPEGGSKAVLAIEPGADKNIAVKSAISGLLDLITVQENGKLVPGIIDYYNREEIIFLGPDENMTDDLINWTIEHALHRGYRYAWSLMSSKPGFGINHKVYGVTSEGVNVYLRNVLEQMNLLDGETTFRIKMTGGPDGDVAGNLLKIIHRDYGPRARVVAIADGLGAAYDPSGLDWTELLRLVDRSLSIVKFSADHLSDASKSFVVAADSRENVKLRDNLYATAEAEVFVPAGGRPFTVKDKNWHKFMKSDGVPSARAIVEGANLFLTEHAREKLVEQGVTVVKDSSANKGGVICSSYEIVACMTLEPQEFADIKDKYVEQVISILKEKADLEAKLLLREHESRGGGADYVKLSYEISSEINRVCDVLRERLDELSDEEIDSGHMKFILFSHCPQILVDQYEERILERLPRAHKLAIISTYVASRLVYKEGVEWLRHKDKQSVYRIATQYIDAEQQIARILNEVSSSGLEDSDKIISILRGVGAKHLASLHT